MRTFAMHRGNRAGQDLSNVPTCPILSLKNLLEFSKRPRNRPGKDLLFDPIIATVPVICVVSIVDDFGVVLDEVGEGT